jgi:predicted small lipoprotein YifL
MKRWVKLVLVAIVVFATIAGVGSLFLPPDVISTAPLSIASLIICWPVSYWFVYYREEKPLFGSEA